MARKLERSDAKMFYCQEFKEVKEISGILNVPEKTIYRWKQEDAEAGEDWDKDRETFRRTPEARAQDIFTTAVDQFNALIEQMKVEKKLDSQALFAVNKNLELAERMMKNRHMYPYILTTVKELIDYMGDADLGNPELLQQLGPYLKKFGVAMAKKYRKN